MTITRGSHSLQGFRVDSTTDATVDQPREEQRSFIDSYQELIQCAGTTDPETSTVCQRGRGEAL